MIGETVSHYRILDQLGGGAMGVVYKAQDLRLKRLVALKFLPPGLTRDVDAKQRFVQEAEAASARDCNEPKLETHGPERGHEQSAGKSGKKRGATAHSVRAQCLREEGSKNQGSAAPASSRAACRTHTSAASPQRICRIEMC